MGGGAVGVACAHYLAEEGLRVTLVDRDELGHGASFANAGLICPGHSQALPGPGIVSEGLRALFRSESEWAVFVVEEGRARLRTIEIGRQNDLEAEVVSGLEAGEQIVTHPGDKLVDGVQVFVR